MKPSTHTRVKAAVALVLLMLLAFLPAVRVRAEEGMFLPDMIDSLPLDKLKKRGLKITPRDLYDPNGVSIKDAIVIVGGGTGEFVSPEGLLLTNHHVAFEALVAASTPEKNYGETGYAAMSRAEELPAEGYTVSITQELKNVTGEVLAGVNADMSQAARNRAIQTKIRELEAVGNNPAEGLRVRVQALNDGMWYYKFTYLVLRDVRVVYAPPESIGFYGGDDDNFEWPRHCGDFTFMRAYVGADGKPADYSKNNVPYKPKKFLPISLDGIKEGDVTLMMGYPGTTRRYRESYSVAFNRDSLLPFQVDFYTNQIRILEDMSKRDRELAVSLQSRLADLNNTMKNFAGSVLALRRENVLEKKRAAEAEFTRWVNAGDAARKAKYGSVLPSLEEAYKGYDRMAIRDLLANQIFGASDLLGIAFFAQQIAADKEKPENERNAALGGANIARARTLISSTLARRNPTVERELLTYMLRAADELPADQKIPVIEKRFGALKGEARRRAEEDFARAVVDSKEFGTAEALSGLFDRSLSQLREVRDPLIEFASELGLES
ncbi:MAG: S46 family peptidase, partial [Pyrinomonadaceae bacterium]|nr:S46 family peptidase [Pyrinomonadaceae bacterium]